MFIRRLLVPIDLSARSVHAVAYACQLAASSGGAEVDVLHVISGPGLLRSAVEGYLQRPMPHATADDLGRARAEVRALVDGVARHGVTPHILVDSGDAAAVIVRTAAENAADLIVMTTRGHRGIGELLLGSVTHKVLNCARCPVLTLSRVDSDRDPGAL
jgi:nucleotide-binding universal stress UspA family protein